MDQTTRKLVTMLKLLHARDGVDIDYTCQEKKEEEESPTFKIVSISSIQRLKDYIKKANSSENKQHSQHKSRQNKNN